RLGMVITSHDVILRARPLDSAG
ncbi:MAG: hypothetical protein QOJ85_4392, partial [Solirubrobacteraceae bacterium]|nr:hypothetical protein [Solirubrobacteraceae bacterium]